MYYVCKMCGRAMWSRVDAPSFCYFDRSDLLENISIVDAKRMGIDFISDRYIIAAIEFAGDARFDMFTGEELGILNIAGHGLADYQRKIMEEVRAS